MAKPKNDKTDSKRNTVGNTGQTKKEIEDTLKNSGWTDDDLDALPPQARRMLGR